MKSTLLLLHWFVIITCLPPNIINRKDSIITNANEELTYVNRSADMISELKWNKSELDNMMNNSALYINSNKENVIDEYCFEVGNFYHWQHTVDIGTAMDFFLRNFTLGFYNNSDFIRLAYATNSSVYVTDENAAKSKYYNGRISTSVFNTTKKRVYTFYINDLKLTDAGIYGLKSYYKPPEIPSMFEIKIKVDIQDSCGTCTKLCPSLSLCVHYQGDGQNCRCQQMYYMGVSESHCFETQKTFSVTGLKLNYKWVKDYESKYTSLYAGFSYHIESALLVFLRNKDLSIGGIFVTNIAKTISKDPSPVTMEFYVYFNKNAKLDPVILKTWLQDGISSNELKSILADKSSDIKVTIVKDHQSISIYYIIGGCIAGIVLLILVIAILVMLKKRRNISYVPVPPTPQPASVPSVSSGSSRDEISEAFPSTYSEELYPTTRDTIAKEVITALPSFAQHLGLGYSDIDQIKADNPNISSTEIVHKLFQKYEQVNNHSLSWGILRKKLMEMGKNYIVAEIDKTYSSSGIAN